MKILPVLLLLTSLTIVRADNNGNLLQNGDFSSGSAHWQGDGHPPDNSGNDIPDLSATPSTTTASPGIVIKLRSHDWTKVLQDFDGNVGEYLLTIKYTAASDLQFSDKADDYNNIPGKVEFSRLMPFNGTPGNWIVIINDLGNLRYEYWQIKPKVNTAGVQTLTCNVKLNSDDAVKKGFYLLFPPGTGAITLQSISLVAKGGASPAAQQ